MLLVSIAPSRPVSSCPVPSRPVPSRLVSSRPVPSRPVSSRLVPSRPVLFLIVLPFWRSVVCSLLVFSIISILASFCVLQFCLWRCFLVPCCDVVSCRCFYRCGVVPDCIVGDGRLRSLFREHKTLLLMLLAQPIRDVAIPDTSLRNDTIPQLIFQ
jgi:hypothetical protein